MKIFINSYACSPYQGSEPGMGWKFVHALMPYHELHVVVEEENFREHIERYQAEHPEEFRNAHFYFIKRDRHPLLRKIWPPSYYWYYKSWQKKVYELARDLDTKENFDVVHHLNMAGYREPGYEWNIGKPSVWGPIGGFENVPWCMIPSMGLRGKIFYTFYNLINSWQMLTNGRVKSAMKKTNVLISATAKIQEKVKELYNRDSVLIPEVGFEGSADNSFAIRKNGENLRICWSGVHEPRKSLNLLLDALAIDKRGDIELHVLGKGTETKRWKKQADNLGLKNIKWYGKIDRSDALNVMQSCHLFCITSLSDLTSTVILEAMSYGMPVIALDHCGFSNVITEDCGRKIAIINKNQVICDFAKAVNEFADDEQLRRRLSEGARNRAMEYKWEDKAQLINRIYESLSV